MCALGFNGAACCAAARHRSLACSVQSLLEHTTKMRTIKKFNSALKNVTSGDLIIRSSIDDVLVIVVAQHLLTTDAIAAIKDGSSKIVLNSKLIGRYGKKLA